MNLRETGSRCQEIICISFKYIPTHNLSRITILQFVHSMNVLGIDLEKYKSLNENTRICDVT